MTKEIWVDGAGWNGKKSKYAIVFDNGHTEIMTTRKNQTNNEMEYRALFAALVMVLPDEKITIYSDSQLVVRQMTGEYQVRADNLISISNECRRLLNNAPNIMLKWIPRKQNKAGILLDKEKKK